MTKTLDEQDKNAIREIRDSKYGRANLTPQTIRELIHAGAINYGPYRGEYLLTKLGKAMASVL